MAKTETGKDVAKAIQKQLEQQQAAYEFAISQGYPDRSGFTDAAYQQLLKLSKAGNKEAKEALARSGRLFNQYRQAGNYDKTNFEDLERKYGKAGKYDAMELEGLRRAYREAGQYDPSEFSRSDYRTQNIQERMSPYEQLVADRQRARLKRTYDEARGEREVQAARAGAFGGSGAAIQEELARRNYAEQLADLDAQSLQAGYEAAVQLYGKEVADRMAAETAEEQSRQFGKGAEFQGLQGVLAARQTEEQSRQFGKGAEFQGIGGALAARQQTAAQVAAAKEAELESLRGMGASAAQQAALAQQAYNKQASTISALQQAGQQEEARNLAHNMYPMSVSQAQAGATGALFGGVQQVPTQGQPNTNWFQTAASLGATAAAALETASDIWKGRRGGLVPSGLQRHRVVRRYNGGGLADLQPQYYSKYER